LKDKPDRQTLLEVQDFFRLPSPALVEKDWHVVQALEATQGATSDGLALVFGGGTALARAHGLLMRMSEDIDLRIVGPKAASRPALQRLRRQVHARLVEKGFTVEGKVTVKQNDRYVRYDLPYAPIMQGEGVLRPEIKIELAAFPIRRPAVEKSVQSFCAEALGRPPEVGRIACVALAETAAEKFVALTRRMGAVFAGAARPDATLVRHLYDLFQLEGRYDVADAVALARDTMRDEAVRGHDAYRADALAETRRTVERMGADADVREGYEKLMAEMVYGDRPDFEGAFAALESFAEGFGQK